VISRDCSQVRACCSATSIHHVPSYDWRATADREPASRTTERFSWMKCGGRLVEIGDSEVTISRACSPTAGRCLSTGLADDLLGIWRPRANGSTMCWRLNEGHACCSSCVDRLARKAARGGLSSHRSNARNHSPAGCRSFAHLRCDQSLSHSCRCV